ncbi:MAG TPA: hypothetical protein VIM11_08280 [Tepidisphaeraceae bacterium]|jgi:hypothetical protein
MRIKTIFRALSIASIFPAILQAFEPFPLLGRWLGQLLSPLNISYSNTTSIGIEACRKLVEAIALLSVPAILWLIADLIPPNPPHSIDAQKPD